MMTSPIEPSLGPSQRVLSLPLAELYEVPIKLRALAGLPAGALDIVAANLVMAATPCDPPLFAQKVRAACARFRRDVMLVRTGLFPETMNPVTVDVALTGPDGPVVLTGQSFLRHNDGRLWLVPQRSGPSVLIDGDGLVLQMTPPSRSPDEHIDGLCRAAAEIVRLVAHRRSR